MKMFSLFSLATLVLILSSAVSSPAHARPALDRFEDLPTNNRTKLIRPMDIVKVRFFKGGGYPRPGKVNFSADMVIEFFSRGLRITAKTETPGCYKTGELSARHRAQLAGIISRLQLSKSLGQSRIDAAVETLEVFLRDGTKLKIYLSVPDAPKGSLIALNGDRLADSLSLLDDSLTEGLCK
jgi:hypothetical protein